MTDTHTKGLAVFKDMAPGLIPDNVTNLRVGGFAGAGYPAAATARKLAREALPSP